ncbi:hypothetical protein EDD63_1652 [Breznakia blatticola]|uniref:Uncharacterized protein n=1 Tax=Breznakia blatticola TaxID=1754012 RepID=A0A4R7Z8A1_9FIRM|nr:hypothetical protein [Breznakia blatticola]TDW08862.1 hypothetical protein EDD63_1652 [Breznakia blatticola]
MKFGKLITICFILLSFMVPVLANEEDVESTDPESIKKPGTYFIKVQVGEPGNEVTRYIKTTITFPKSKINEKNQEGIDASDIRIQPNTIQNLSNKELINKANVRAWSLIDGKSVPITKVMVKKSNESQVAYVVTFSTKKNTSIQANVYEGQVSKMSFETLAIYLSEEHQSNRWSITSIAVGMSILPIILILVVSFYLQKQLHASQQILYEK